MAESTNNRKDKLIMRECISALTYYAVSATFEDKSASAISAKVRDLIEHTMLYWGLENEAAINDYLDKFDNEVEESMRGNLLGPTVDVFSACADALTGLSVHGMDLINAHENDAYAMEQALAVGNLMNEIANHFGITQEMTFASDTNRQI